VIGWLLTRVYSPRGLRVALPAAVLGVVGAGVLFSLVEGRGVSAWDGVWWAFTTVSTVGYGDVTPRTDAGRALALGVIVVGVGFLFLLAGALIERFIAIEVRHDLLGIEQPERQILQRLEAVDARLAEIDARLGRLEPPAHDRAAHAAGGGMDAPRSSSD
jgi:voltage-gated potassium channel